MKKMIFPAIALLLVLTVALAGCGASKDTSPDSPPDSASSGQGNNQSDSSGESSASTAGLLGTFETTDLEGNPVSQDIISKAALTMVNVWATYCRPCIQEMPELAELSDEYQDKMQIVGIISDVTQAKDETATLIIDQSKADYTHLLISQDLYDNFLSQVQVVPTTVFLDREGNQVGKVYAGARDKDGWKKIIDEMLEKVNES